MAHYIATLILAMRCFDSADDLMMSRPLALMTVRGKLEKRLEWMVDH